MIATFREAEERLAVALPGYESRPQQRALAEAVETAIVNRRHLLGEAGTGTGKSLGYLIPSILAGRRVVVSTATKALQDQIALKDLPFLSENLGVDFTFAILKGRSNYLCLNALNLADAAEVPSMGKIRERIKDEDFDGEIDSLGFDLTPRERVLVAAETDNCKSYGCRSNLQCYAEQAKAAARDSDVVVVNHALYLMDLYVQDVTFGNGDLIGYHEVVVFDEAHEIEDYAGGILGSTFKEGTFRGLATEARNLARRLGLPVHAWDAAASEMIFAMENLWEVLKPGRIRANDLLEYGDQFVGMANALIDLDALFASKPRGLDKFDSQRWDRLSVRAENAASRFSKLVTDDFADVVRWVETDSKGGLVLRAAPIDVGPWLSKMLFGRGLTTAVLVSATLSVNGSFGYIASRLGVGEHDALDVGTPFDYPNQGVLYVPSLPDPSAERAAWSNLAIHEMGELVRESQGRALLLFTSVSEMRTAYETLSPRLPYACYMQGNGMTNKELAERFRDETDSVLFATKSFMTGVDFQGETLSLVVINKLPFPVPDEPLIEARCEAIKRRGGSDFVEYTIPTMTLTLKQAAGRLIRHRNDRGVLAILDPRLDTKGYGNGIMRSLPPLSRIESLDQVGAFLKEAV